MTIHISDLRGQRVYLDANVFIYFLDATPNRAANASRVLQAAADGIFGVVTSEAVVAEVMVGPYRTGDPLLIRTVKQFFRQPALIEVVTHSAQAFDDAAMLRATNGMPFIDALHVATAASARCDSLITNDRRMKSALGVEVIPLRSLID